MAYRHPTPCLEKGCHQRQDTGSSAKHPSLRSSPFFIEGRMRTKDLDVQRKMSCSGPEGRGRAIGQGKGKRGERERSHGWMATMFSLGQSEVRRGRTPRTTQGRVRARNDCYRVFRAIQPLHVDDRVREWSNSSETYVAWASQLALVKYG